MRFSGRTTTAVMDLYDIGGFGTLGEKIDTLSRTLEQTRIAVERAGVDIGHSAEALHKQLGETTTSILSSADIIKASVESSSMWLTGAMKVSNEAASKNAQEIKNQIAELSANLAHASTDLQTANAQSSRLSLRLIWLTGALFFAAIVTAGATAFQAYETKRQADLIQEQLRRQASHSSEVRPNVHPESN
jgi:hypothetical protein